MHRNNAASKISSKFYFSPAINESGHSGRSHLLLRLERLGSYPRSEDRVRLEFVETISASTVDSFR